MIRDTLLQNGVPAALIRLRLPPLRVGRCRRRVLGGREGRVWNRIFPFLEAVALGCWAAAGAQKTLGAGLGWLPAILLGTITRSAVVRCATWSCAARPVSSV